MQTEMPPPAGGDRLAWFRDARFGMFIHWGLYSLLERGEWVKHQEAIPDAAYAALAKRFRPAPDCIPAWLDLARRAGQRYAVLTTKHHDGFCLFESAQTDFHSVAAAAGRDYVREYVAACRNAGLKVGLYYSLGDWHEPAYRAVAAGREDQVPRLRAFLHGQVRELLSNYGPIDLLWYDGAWFDGEYLSPKVLDSDGLHRLARELQPGILINDRAGPPADYATPENECRPAPPGRDWEMCTCINDLWGYARHDYNYKTVNQLIFLLVNCAVQGGNLLLNIGPRADGSVPAPQVERLEAVGAWLQRHGESVYGCERLGRPFFGGGRVTRRGGVLYLHTFYWPGSAVRVPGLLGEMPGAAPRPLEATVLTTGEPARARWEGTVLVLEDLPETPPDRADTVIALRPS
jgi:alpha-L-fucosidase